MQLFSRKKALVAVSLGALAALGACGDNVTVPITSTPPVVLSITPPSLNLNIGETGSFAVQISGGSTTTPPTLSTCTSSTPSVATVALSGSQCRVTAIATGNATITATSSSGGAVNAQVSVSAQNAAITNLTVSPSQANLAVGQTIPITPNVQKAAAAVTTTTTYATSTASVATVSATGVVTAVGPGIATITVTTTGSGAGYTTTALTQAVTINVGALAAGITSLTVQPTSLALPLGQTFNFDTATVRSGVVQPAGAPRAVITFGSSNPAVATVNQNTGAVTSVGPGTAVITVTATSPANSQFAASTLTQLISVNVSPGATVTIAQINQGPILTTYLDDSTAVGSTTGGTASNGQPLNGGAAAGILTAANPQVDQPIDITNVRDQIQVIANLSPNGQRVDSAVVFIRGVSGADTVRRAAARQIFSNGQANVGPITLFVNTADFSVDTTAGTANVFYKNGQKIISVAVFTTTNGQAVEIQNASNNRQTVNFNNIDGYALIYGNPARSALNPGTNLNFFGGPGPEGTGSFTVIPVFYTPGRLLTSATLGLRQGLFGSIDVCNAINGTVPFSRETFTGNPTLPPPAIRGTINGVNGRNVSGGTSTTASTVGNANIECGGFESPSTTAGNVIAVVAATDNTNNPAPRVTFAAGYRFSTSVARPTPNRFDFRGPVVPEPDIRRTGTTSTTTWTMPAVTGWVNGTFNFNTTTALSSDSASGTSNMRTLTYSGCGATNVAVPSGTGADIPECATNLLGGYVVGGTPAGFYGISTRGPYTVMFSEGDRLGNIGTSVASQPFGVDKTAPLIRFSQSSSPDTTIGAFTFQAEVIDERSGFIDAFFDNGAIERNPTSNANLPLATATLGSQQQFASRGAGLIGDPADHTNCINPNSVTPFLNSSSTALSAQPFMTAPNCTYRILPAASISGTLSDGYRSAFLVNIPFDGLYRYQTRVYDRAGNVSDVAARRAARDLTAPPTVTDLNVPIVLDSTAVPTFQVTASDNVELRANNISLGYGAAIPGSLRLRYPQMLLDARFNDFVNSPNQRNLTVPLPAPFVISLQNTNSNVPPTSNTPGNVNVADVQATLFDVANAPGQSPTVSLAATSFSLQNSFGTVNSTGAFTSFSITPSTAAGFNAGAGVKAQLISNTNVTNQQFVRVDFYRLANGEYQFLGSVNTPAVADQGNSRYFTYVLPDAQFAATPLALETQQAPVATGDNIIAIGVRANGSGLVTGAATVIGSQLATISIPVTGLPSGVSGNITVSCPSAGINQTLTGPASIQVGAGVTCTITPNNSSPAPGTGLVYTPTPNAPFMVTSGAAGTTVTSTTINYAGGQTLQVAINGLPSAPATPVVTVSGPSGTFNRSATDSVSQLAPGTYSIGAVGSVTIAGTTYVLQSQTATSASVTANSINPTSVTLTYVAAGTLSGQGALAAGGPASTTLTVTGGSLTTPRTLQGSSGGLNFTLLSLAPGTYTVTSGAVAGFAGPTPTTQTVTVSAGATATLGTAIVYTPLGSINLTTTCTSGGSVVACPTGFTNPIVVTGPNGFNQTVSNTGTLSALPAGTYTITPSGDITINGVTYFSGGSYTVNVTNGTISSAASNFTMAGSIIVNISGLPAGTNANVVLTIQGGSTSVLTQSSTIPNVKPGTVYSIVINDRIVGGTTYAANPNNYIGLTVNSGAGTTTNIVYQPQP